MKTCFILGTFHPIFFFYFRRKKNPFLREKKTFPRVEFRSPDSVLNFPSFYHSPFPIESSGCLRCNSQSTQELGEEKNWPIAETELKLAGGTVVMMPSTGIDEDF